MTAFSDNARGGQIGAGTLLGVDIDRIAFGRLVVTTSYAIAFGTLNLNAKESITNQVAQQLSVCRL